MDSSKIPLSIITINYNDSKGLSKTIKSVVGQSYKDIEYIVIDGGSSDGSKEVIEEYEKYLNYWVSEPDSGIYNAMNKGIRASHGEYLLFLNSGDVLHSDDVIENVVPALGNHDMVIGKVLFENSGQTNELPEELTLLRFYHGSVPHPSTFIRRKIMLEYMFDEWLKIVSDWKFFMQALIIGNASYTHLNLIITDFDTSGVSATNKVLVERERAQVLKELFPERIRKDYLHFIHGSEYTDDDYDRFFRRIKDFTYGKWVYKVAVLLLRFISLFRKNMRFAEEFPINRFN